MPSKKKAPKSARKSTIIQVEIKYKFTQDELNALGPKIANLTKQVQDKRAAKKEIVAELNAEIQGLEMDFSENVDRLNNGWENRFVRARKYKNFATEMWEFYSVVDFSLVHEEPFRESDYQVDVDHATATEPAPFSDLDEQAPKPEGTEVTNPALFEQCLRELNHYRALMAQISLIEDEDDQIEQGRAIERKIAGLETTLREMQVVEDENEEQGVQLRDRSNDSDSPIIDNDQQLVIDLPNGQAEAPANQTEPTDKPVEGEQAEPTDQVNDEPADQANDSEPRQVSDIMREMREGNTTDQPEQEKPKYPNRFKSGSEPWNKGRLTTQGEDGTPSPRKDDDQDDEENKM